MRKLAFLLGMWLVTMAMADNRAHASRKANDTKNRVSADYVAHWTAINANTTARTAINTGSGGTGQENFLGALGQMSHQSSASTSGIGIISGTPSDTEYNATNTALNALVNSYNTLLSHLQAQGYMS